MNYPAVSITDAATELNRLHGEIEQKLRTTVQDAIRAGEILAQVKDRLEHGEFLPWIEDNCEFSHDTARNYVRLYVYADKIRTVRNLQDAYREVAQIESREKQSEERQSRERVVEYIKTGVKPEGWRRGTDDKRAQQEQSRREEMDRTKEELKQERKEKADSFSKTESLLDPEIQVFLDHTEKRQAFKERIRLSQYGESDAFVDAIMDYLDELEDDNRRIEACQNIIKVCRNVANQLQRET